MLNDTLASASSELILYLVNGRDGSLLASSLSLAFSQFSFFGIFCADDIDVLYAQEETDALQVLCLNSLDSGA